MITDNGDRSVKYGDYVKMKELEVHNNGRWEPIKITEEEYFNELNKQHSVFRNSA